MFTYLVIVQALIPGLDNRFARIGFSLIKTTNIVTIYTRI